MSMAVDDLLDAAAAARHVGCSVRTIHHRRQHHGLVPVVIGSSRFFTAEALDAHFAEKPLDVGKGRYHRKKF